MSELRGMEARLAKPGSTKLSKESKSELTEMDNQVNIYHVFKIWFIVRCAFIIEYFILFFVSDSAFFFLIMNLSQILHKIQTELDVRNKELHVAVENSKRLLSENKILEQSVFNIENRKTEEVNFMYLIYGRFQIEK